jgi:predicted nuclease of predicted toxin-antitoxin system
MKFLVDECTGPGVASWLCNEGHEVFSVYDESPGIDDLTILAKANSEHWILITNDNDFSVRIFRDQLPHSGVVFLRLANERTQNKIDVIRDLLLNHAESLSNRFVVVTESKVRFSK